MRFIAKAVPAGDFNGWVAKARGTGPALDDAGYAKLAKPSKAVPPTTYRSVEPKLFERIIDQTKSRVPDNKGGAPAPPGVRRCDGRRLRCWAG